MKRICKIFLIGLLCFLSDLSFSQGQFWRINGNNNTSVTNNFLGTTTNDGLSIRTFGIQRAEFTTNFALGVNTVIPGIGTGDGLRIMPRTLGCSSVSLPTATLDLWTSCSNGTNIRWDNSGQISGTNSRFEIWGNYNGFWFNGEGSGKGL